jgi:hypothetical protein
MPLPSPTILPAVTHVDLDSDCYPRVWIAPNKERVIVFSHLEELAVRLSEIAQTKTFTVEELAARGVSLDLLEAQMRRLEL